jgi:hypothetical protein
VPDFSRLSEGHPLANPKRIWKDLISGKKTLDTGDFLTALIALSDVPDWREAFLGLGSSATVFLDRLETFFDLRRGGPVSGDDDRSKVDHPPARQNVSNDFLVSLARAHLNDVADMAEDISQPDTAKILRALPIEWVEAPDPEPYSYSTLAQALHNIPGEAYDTNQFAGWSHIHWCLSEACYGLATSYDLQRYLMQDFYTMRANPSHLYKLQWEYGATMYATDTSCAVGLLKARTR